MCTDLKGILFMKHPKGCNDGSDKVSNLIKNLCGLKLFVGTKNYQLYHRTRISIE